LDFPLIPWIRKGKKELARLPNNFCPFKENVKYPMLNLKYPLKKLNDEIQIKFRLVTGLWFDASRSYDAGRSRGSV